MYKYKEYIVLCLWSVFLSTLSSEKVDKAAGKKYIKYPSASHKAVDWMEYRYDVDSMRLEKIETTKICKANMRFFANPDNETLGECDCDYFDCSRPLIYSPKTKQCHWAWSQGPCDKGEWYVFNDKLKPICEKDGCANPKNKIPEAAFSFKRKEDDKCYEVGSRGYCKDEDEFLGTSLDEPIPSCRKYVLCGGASFPAIQQCIPGHKWTFDGRC